MKKTIEAILQESIDVKHTILQDDLLKSLIETIVNCLVDAFKQDKKVLFCGNGGSAADAQHLAAEFSNKFKMDRKPLDAEALHINTSYLTAVSNDYSFDEVYAKLVEAKGKAKDVLIAISTSGNSKNIIEAAKMAKQKKMIVIAWTGKNNSELSKHCDILLKIPSENTARIQEAHITIGHIICELVEKAIF